MEYKLSFNIPPTRFVQAGPFFDETPIVMNSCVNCVVLNRGSGPFQECFNGVTCRVQITGRHLTHISTFYYFIYVLL